MLTAEERARQERPALDELYDILLEMAARCGRTDRPNLEQMSFGQAALCGRIRDRARRMARLEPMGFHLARKANNA